MKTLIVEADLMRARSWTALYAGAKETVHVARTPAQARLMLIGGVYDRLCLRMGAQGGASHALLAVARATNPDCEFVDLASMRVRGVSGQVLDHDIPGLDTASPH